MPYKCMKLMSEYNKKWCLLNRLLQTVHSNIQYLRYAEKSDLGKWPKMTSPVEHSECLRINFNIFNDKNYCVT